MSLQFETKEVLLWEGRPHSGLLLGIEMIAITFFSSILLLFTIILASVLPSKSGIIWPVLLCGGSVSLLFLLAYPTIDMLKRRRTSYVLTNKRAIHLHNGNDVIHEVRREDWNALQLVDSDPPSVEYARLSTSFANMRTNGRIPAQKKTMGFWRFKEAPQVYKLMKELIENKN